MSTSGSARGWLPDARYRQRAFVPSDGGKMFCMSVGVYGAGAWATVRCTGVIRQYKFLSTGSLRKHLNIPEFF